MSAARTRTPNILLRPAGFSIVDNGLTASHVDWSRVKEIVAFKVDLITHDTIRIALRVSDDGRFWEVDEDWPGFEELVGEIERRFDVDDKNWRSNVAFPPFATNRTRLWGEPQSPAEE